VLGLSSKRSVVNHVLKSDMPCLEFNMVQRNTIIGSTLQPHEMQWSMEEFIKKSEATEKINKERMDDILD